MTANLRLNDALDDLYQASHLLDLLRLAASGMGGDAKCSDSAAIAAGIEVVASNVTIAISRLRELNDAREASHAPHDHSPHRCSPRA